MNQLFHDHKIVTPDGTYTPFLAPDGRVGYVFVFPDGRTTFVYCNPSTENDDGQPNVFIYQGASTDIEHGLPIVYVDVKREPSI
jgi:hypothetical protein